MLVESVDFGDATFRSSCNGTGYDNYSTALKSLQMADPENTTTLQVLDRIKKVSDKHEYATFYHLSTGILSRPFHC